MVYTKMNSNQSNSQSEEDLNLTKFLITNAKDAVLWITPEAGFVCVNDAACEFTGYSREDLLTMTVEDIDPNFTPEVWSEVWKTIKQQGSIHGRYIYQNKEKKVIPVEVTANYSEYKNKESCCVFIEELIKDKQLEGVSSIFPNSPKLNDVFQFIEANYHQAITLCDVAQAVDYSPAYLTDLVRRQTGKTVNQWIVERRMAEVCRLLLDTNQTANEIAWSVGYQNEAHFFRQFRQYHGTTPQVWRNWQRTQLIVENNLKNC
jgi:PAS domain S-box-containing protein